MTRNIRVRSPDDHPRRRSHSSGPPSPSRPAPPRPGSGGWRAGSRKRWREPAAARKGDVQAACQGIETRHLNANRRNSPASAGSYGRKWVPREGGGMTRNIRVRFSRKSRGGAAPGDADDPAVASGAEREIRRRVPGIRSFPRRRSHSSGPVPHRRRKSRSGGGGVPGHPHLRGQRPLARGAAGGGPVPGSDGASPQPRGRGARPVTRGAARGADPGYRGRGRGCPRTGPRPGSRRRSGRLSGD